MSEKNLVIVESPAKAKTIEKYLGKDFKVVSSMGHVRDLPKDDKAIDIKNGFKPKYEITPDKKETVKKLKEYAKNAETVWLATDADREGEAISWHLMKALDLEENRTKRIVFREITKKAITESIQHPRTIDYDLVNAQQARRILDRIVGFELSPVLWKKVKTGLSAGRVQSAAVRLVVEREREIDQFNAKSSYKVIAEFDLGNSKILKAEIAKNFETEAEAKKFLEDCINSEFKVSDIEKKIERKNPSAPFTTSTLQQEASRKLGFSVGQTMLVAQKLYEAGHISYMRTDSTSLSDEALAKASEQIRVAYGDEYLKTRRYETKSESAQEAHEAIRPTDFSKNEIHGMGRNEQRLYNLIWKRSIASQMETAEIEKTIATITISNNPFKLIATADVIKFDGFLKVYIESTDDEDDQDEENATMPSLSIGQILDLITINAIQKFTNAPPRYTEASLVKKLEELGIGRPSTYAPTISTIQKRDYIVKESRNGVERSYKKLNLTNGKISSETLIQTVGSEKNKLFPTNTAMVVSDFLIQNFEDVVDYSFTANVEKEFDEIAKGKKIWEEVLTDFYGEFHENVERTTVLPRVTKETARTLGDDPVSGQPIYVKLGRYGAYAQIGDGADGSKPRFASLKKGQFIESITLNEALDLFKLPRDLGDYEGYKMTVSIGRFGPYVSCHSKFYSLTKEDDPYTITRERAIEIIENKRKADAEKTLKSYDEDPELKVLNGRWGPYIYYHKENIKLPKGSIALELTFEECMKIVNSHLELNPPKGKKSAVSEKTKETKKKKTKTTAKKATKSTKKKTTKKKTTKK